ncbi:hypothetical protein FRC12_013469 [Ceratobasidium sp. 428]|nr:hypothetical protein FRC12_013469 [Ceratobasidium sp. 428]
MSTSAAAGPSKRRGQYSSRACNGCRRRRCKCDGVQPTCGTCSLYCDWSGEVDARRPVTKQLVDSLRAKIQLLESTVEQLRAANPAIATSPLSDAAMPLPTSPAHSGGPSTSKQNWLDLNTSFRPALPVDQQLELGDDASEAERPQPPPSHLIATVIYRYVFQTDHTIPPHKQPNDIRLSLVCDWNRYLPQLPGVHFSRQEHDILLLRCFKYGTSWLMGLVPELFLHDMLYLLTSDTVGSQPLSSSQLQHYSPMLHCSIMAFAAAFSDDPMIRAPETRGRFASCAKQWLDEEFQRPVTSLVRSLALLAEYHCGIGDMDAGYMYMGMSLRAARIFMSKADDDIAPNEGVITLPESISRGWHFWSAFGQDKLMAIEYNRDYEMPAPPATVPLPSIDDELDTASWPSEPPAAPGPAPSKVITTTFHETTKLMLIATRIIDIGTYQENHLVEEHVIIDTHLRLDTWFNALPEKLLVWARSASPLPHMIVLHICYWCLLITLHQPFYPKEQSSGQDGQRMSITDLSIKMCDRAAHKIVQLIRMFDDQHGLRFFPRNMLQAISTCGNALIREYASAPPAANKRRSNATDGISTCISALRTISGTWPSANARADELHSRLQERFTPVFPLTQVDGSSFDPPAASMSAEQEHQDNADISSLFHQYMHEWSHMPLPHMSAESSVFGSESPFSQPGEGR